VTMSNLPNWDNLRDKYAVHSSHLRLEIEGEFVKFGLVLRRGSLLWLWGSVLITKAPCRLGPAKKNSRLLANQILLLVLALFLFPLVGCYVSVSTVSQTFSKSWRPNTSLVLETDPKISAYVRTDASVQCRKVRTSRTAIALSSFSRNPREAA
jgi:hypothetical protein